MLFGSTIQERDRVIRLTNRELAMGAECGVMRNIASIRAGHKDANGFTDEYGWNAHIEGACGEIAVARLLGRYWSPSVNAFDAADIGQKIHVRTRSQHNYDLLIRPKDTKNPDHAFVLVTGRAPEFVVRGYRLCRDCLNDEWRQEYGGRPPAWFVPQSALWSVTDLMLKKFIPARFNNLAECNGNDQR